MPTPVTFYCIVYAHPLDGVKVVAIFTNRTKAIDYVTGLDQYRIKEITTTAEAM